MKQIWQSKTFWFNALTTAAGVLGVLAASPLISEYPRVAAGITSAIGVVNIGLRVVTIEPVKRPAVRKKKKEK